MATQKDKKTFQQRTVEGIKGGVEETSGSRLLDLMAVIQEMLGTTEKKKKKGQ
jgi:hypothetical protein